MLFPSIQNELQNLKEHYENVWEPNFIFPLAQGKVVQYCDDMVTTYFKMY